MQNITEDAVHITNAIGLHKTTHEIFTKKLLTFLQQNSHSRATKDSPLVQLLTDGNYKIDNSPCQIIHLGKQFYKHQNYHYAL